MAALAALMVMAAASLSPVGTPASAGEPPQAPPAPAQVVVQFDPASSRSERHADLAERGMRLVEQPPGSDFALAVASDGTAAQPVAAGGSIEAVEPVVTYEAFGAPNDPAYRFQWHLSTIGASSAWDVTTGAGTVVAVIDSGVAYEDFGAFRRAPDLAGTTFVPGYDFVDGDSHANDENGHGTHVASIIAATTNNEIGVAGVAPGAAIMPLRILGKDGRGSDFAAAQALRFAADHGADVANLSFGGPDPSPVVADAVAYARSKGVVVVAASGNTPSGGGPVSYPAADEGVVAVGALRYDRTRAAYSNFGPALDLTAPGGHENAKVDQNGDGYGDGILAETFLVQGDPKSFGYGFLSGTSMAAPQVSAVAAMVVARGVQSPEGVADVLVRSARDLGVAGRDDDYGSGLLRAAIAVRMAGPASTVAASVRGVTYACPSDSTPPSAFTDIGSTVHASSVRCVAWWDIARGTSETTFAPNGRVTRAQMASFVARLLEQSGRPLPETPPDAFTDDDGSVHERAIDQLAAIGVVKGRGGTTYAPSADVTRAEMATFLVRAHDLVAEAPLVAGADRFLDDDTSVHEPNIDKAAGAGLAAGNSAVTFAPSSPVLRGQMATFLARTLDLFVATGATPPR